MDIRQISPDYSVSPQIEPADMPAIKAAGFRAVICNRPDAEVPHELSAELMRIAAEEAGLDFIVIPVTHQTLNMDMVATQMDALAHAGGPVLAYCASGTRSSIVWSLGQAGKLTADAIIAATARAGYDLAGLRPRLEAITG
jgi:uncharacterized protein (TIGR01244 family)